ncbi:class I histocompatibility antigen, F10 alpha chain-like isoform X2 [Pangasianodon hypophthalmus]|uniref:class I histocompatibility antigen, F10 alpha chain-like isoform X2 n=1 Tax=Pangasianodon hypophthalmus TaxID=310915 RepID=UPI000EFEFE82|nr:class I histocompatibility antigen, F10 alpha chain-like isoform X2 [Pangasianodon hypophthalmus]
MDLRLALKKLLLSLMIIFPHASAVTHSVQYLYTALTPGINLTAVGLLDGEQFVYYDSNIRKTIPKTEWVKKISADDPDYWNRLTQRMQRDQENLKQLLDTVMKDFNHTEGGHTLQRTYGCELDDDGTARGNDQIRYDGEDFISLDLKTGTWTAVNDKALITKEKWETVGPDANIQKNYLEKECIEWLKKYVSYSRETVKRKGGGLSGLQTAIITVSVVAFFALLAGLIICKKCKSGEREDYI